jgi:biopolymer transport protein TolQ
MMASAIELAGTGPDLSFVAMFLEADIIVKAVMAILAVASVWSWAVVIDKQRQFMSLSGMAKRFERDFWERGRSLDQLGEEFKDRPEPWAKIFNAAYREFDLGRDQSTGSALLTINQRIDRVMSLVAMREVTKAERGLGVLASIGSASPFIGLFGTVWGIMRSFADIASSQDTNLAVVAPGIAEALFATALGLVAAVPAVIFYNKFASDTSRFASHLEGFAEELSAILSRRLQGAPPEAPATSARRSQARGA